MKFLLDFFPILLFFAAFKLFDIYVATAVAMVTTLGQIAWLRFKTGRVEPMQWLSLGVIVLFGGATLLAHDETFIKWKPTVLYALMALALWGGWLLARRNFIRTLMQSQLRLPDPVWQHLMHAWAGFFSFMAVLNLWVAYEFDTDTWVNFKLFGGLGLMVLFVIAQALYLGRHIENDA
jgi:intracellular septation protein